MSAGSQVHCVQQARGPVSHLRQLCTPHVLREEFKELRRLKNAAAASESGSRQRPGKKRVLLV